MKFSIKDFFSKCDQIRRKLHFLCNVLSRSKTDMILITSGWITLQNNLIPTEENNPKEYYLGMLSRMFMNSNVKRGVKIFFT